VRDPKKGTVKDKMGQLIVGTVVLVIALINEFS